MSDNKVLTVWLPVAAAVVIMSVTCYVQGMWSERWGTFPELELFAEQLNAIPINVGQWQGTDLGKSDEKILKIAGAAGEMMRTYRNAAGEEVRVSIICARKQDIFYHTPDRCYPAAGFEMQGEPHPEAFEIGGDDAAEFFTTSFLKSEPTGTHAERGYWSWSATGKWIAPKNPNLAFAGKKALYKLYVFANIPPGKTAPTDQGFCEDFIRVFIPALETSLRPAFEGSAKARAAAGEGAAEQKPAA